MENSKSTTNSLGLTNIVLNNIIVAIQIIASKKSVIKLQIFLRRHFDEKYNSNRRFTQYS